MIQRQKCPVITIANPKGGVGKTTAAINLAHALGMQRHRVLLLDLDPMRTATLDSGEAPAEDWLEQYIKDPATDDEFKRLVITRVGFHLIPAGPLLWMTEIVMSRGKLGAGWLQHLVASLSQDYDLILIDTAPGQSELRRAAIEIATQVLAPVDPSPGAIEGLQRLAEEAKRLSPHNGEDPWFIAPFVMRYPLTSGWDINLFKTRIAEALEGCVLASSIRDAKFMTQSAWEQESVYTHKLGSGVGKDFFGLAEELVELIGI